MKLALLPRSEAILRPGDIFRDHYFPTVLPGRTEAFRNDIRFILNIWMNNLPPIFMASQNKTKNKASEEPVETAFYQFAKSFREIKFSLIHAKTDLEDEYDCWNILCGVWSEEFKSSSQSLGYSTGMIYLLCLLYYTQYKTKSTDKDPKSILMTLDTFHEILDIMERTESINLSLEIRGILNLMNNDGAFIFTCRDGPSYYYQNRVGNPLPVNKDLIFSRRLQLKRTDLRALSERIDEPFKKVQKVISNFERNKNNDTSLPQNQQPSSYSYLQIDELIQYLKASDPCYSN